MLIPAARTRSEFRGWWAASGLVSLGILMAELVRWSNADQRLFALFGSLCGEQPDWAPFLPFALWLPILWRGRPRGGSSIASRPATTAGDRRRDLIAAMILMGVVGIVALLMSHAVGSAFSDARGRPFPPAYHDEFSYLFQAQTFLAGRTWFPSFEPRPELFDQLHVLNLGRFASRYFPGLGVWLAPFVAQGDPWRAQAVAHACCAILIFWIGRELRGNLCGAVAGLLFALSPGLALFSTLLLAHHATLLGLLVFLWMFLRLMRRPDPGTALIAGGGLAWAMLCRPMTAAGFALPFGIWTVCYLARGARGLPDSGPSSVHRTSPGTKEVAGACPPVAVDSIRRRVQVGVGLALPLLAGLTVLLSYSWTITGDPLMSPYQLYTDVYTPRHVYGFNNVIRGERHLGPHVVQNYDEWAENLTLRLAAANTWRRFVASLRLTLGIVPIAFAAALLLFNRSLCRRLRLILAAITSLFAVHVPYWFVGIMEWHYVLEAAPLWLLLVGAATSELQQSCRQLRWYGPIGWWSGVLAMAVAANSIHVPLTTSKDETWWLWRARLPQLMDEVGFARSRYAAVADEADRLRRNRRAVLLVIPDPADRSLDYVTNEPSLAGEVIRVRVPTAETDVAAWRRISKLFPDRLPLVFDAAAGRLGPLVTE